jgi:hypothetical protein
MRLADWALSMGCRVGATSSPALSRLSGHSDIRSGEPNVGEPTG